MEKQYVCPHCSTHVKIDNFIILLGRNNKNEKGLLLLHPEVGNYSSIKHPSFEIGKNEAVELFCPICHKSLASDFDENLSHLKLLENNKTYDIYFSKIHGEQSTFIVNGDNITATGEHSDKYTYFKMGDKFKQYLKK